MLLGWRHTCLTWQCPGGFLLGPHPLLCTNKKKRGGLMYQSISKNASSELCAYPDKSGSPKVVYQSELMPPWVHRTDQSPPQQHQLWMQMSQTQNSSFLARLRTQTQHLASHLAFSSTSARAKSQLPALLNLEESSSMSILQGQPVWCFLRSLRFCIIYSKL